MDDPAKNQFDALATLWKGAWEQFNERRKYEFQISIAVWTALGSFSGFVLSKGKLDINKPLAYGLILCLIWVFVLYVGWTIGLSTANKKDRDKALHYEQKLQSLSQSLFGIGLQNSLSRHSSKIILLTWSHGTQIWITCMLTIMAIGCVYHFGLAK